MPVDPPEGIVDWILRVTQDHKTRFLDAEKEIASPADVVACTPDVARYGHP